MRKPGFPLSNPEKIGYLEFYFGAGKSRPDWTAEVFVTSEFSGGERESAEGKLRWFSAEEFPYDQMWEDDTTGFH